MDRARAMRMKLREVQLRAVTFVLAEAILRKTRAEIAHDHIARDLRDDARSRDTEAEAIAIDDRRLRKREGEHGQAINERVIGLRAERGNGSTHRFVGRAQNVDFINLRGIDNADGPDDRAVPRDLAVDFFAPLGEKLLRIVEATMAELFRKNSGRGHDWSGKRAATSFINSGDTRETDRAQFPLVSESAAAITPWGWSVGVS